MALPPGFWLFRRARCPRLNKWGYARYAKERSDAASFGARILNARGYKHVGLAATESFAVRSHTSQTMAIVLRGVLHGELHKRALSLLRDAHEQCALPWTFGCEADLVPDFERMQGALKRPRHAAGLKVVEGFTVHKIGFKSDDQCASSPVPTPHPLP